MPVGAELRLQIGLTQADDGNAARREGGTRGMASIWAHGVVGYHARLACERCWVQFPMCPFFLTTPAAFSILDGLYSNVADPARPVLWLSTRESRRDALYKRHARNVKSFVSRGSVLRRGQALHYVHGIGNVHTDVDIHILLTSASHFQAPQCA